MNSIEELKEEFEGKINALTEQVAIKSDNDSQYFIKHVIREDLDALGLILEKLEQERDRKLKIIKEAQDFKQKTLKLMDLLQPNSAKNITTATAATTTTINKNNNNNNDDSTSQCDIQPKKRTPNYDYDDYDNNNNGDIYLDNSFNYSDVPKKCDLKISATNLLVSEIKHITEQEYSKLSKYMLGRLTIDKINTTIDTLNSVCSSKYDIIATQKSKQTDKIRNMIREYKDEENKDTKGYNFITENDIKRFSSLKVDKSLYSILIILRHCSRVREVRGGNLIRYVFV